MRFDTERAARALIRAEALYDSGWFHYRNRRGRPPKHLGRIILMARVLRQEGIRRGTIAKIIVWDLNQRKLTAGLRKDDRNEPALADWTVKKVLSQLNRSKRHWR